MHIVNKAGIGFGFFGGIAGTTFAIYQKLSKEGVEKKLTSDGYQILDSSSKEWKSILDSYIKIVKIDSDLKFDNFDFESEEGLKEKCKEALSKRSLDEKNYRRVAKWCVVPKTILDWLPKDKYSRLDTTKDKDDLNQNEWNSKIDKHNLRGQKGVFKYLARLAGGIEKNKDGRNAIKEHCSRLDNKKHHEPSFDSDLEKAKLWCYIEKI